MHLQVMLRFHEVALLREAKQIFTLFPDKYLQLASRAGESCSKNCHA